MKYTIFPAFPHGVNLSKLSTVGDGNGNTIGHYWEQPAARFAFVDVRWDRMPELSPYKAYSLRRTGHREGTGCLELCMREDGNPVDAWWAWTKYWATYRLFTFELWLMLNAEAFNMMDRPLNCNGSWWSNFKPPWKRNTRTGSWKPSYKLVPWNRVSR